MSRERHELIAELLENLHSQKHLPSKLCTAPTPRGAPSPDLLQACREIATLRLLAAKMYAAAGNFDLPVGWLDALLAASGGEPINEEAVETGPVTGAAFLVVETSEGADLHDAKTHRNQWLEAVERMGQRATTLDERDYWWHEYRAMVHFLNLVSSIATTGHEAYPPLSLEEVRDLTAMHSAAPWDDTTLQALADVLAIYDTLRAEGRRPVDPADELPPVTESSATEPPKPAAGPTAQQMHYLLQQIGHALDLPAGSDILRYIMPALQTRLQPAPNVSEAMRFYNVETVSDLVTAMERHITRLQARCPAHPPLP